MNKMNTIRTDHRQYMHLRKIKRKEEKANKHIETFKKHQNKDKTNHKNTTKSAMSQHMDFELKNHTISKC